MRVSNDLFELIRTMDKTEKRYFVLNSSNVKRSRKIYLELFKALDKEKNYNEKEFKRKYKNEKFCRNFAFNKNHLYGLIIRSLTDYSYSSKADGKMHAMIAECWVLFNRALYPKYFRAIAKAKEFAYRHEKYGYLLQILDMERIIIPKKLIQVQKADEIMNEASEASGKMMKIFEYGKTSSLLLNNFRYYGLSRDKEQSLVLDRILKENLPDTENEIQSNRALEGYWRVIEILSGIKGDNEKRYEALLKRYEIVQNDPYPFKDYILNYPVNILYALIECCLPMNKAEEAEYFMSKLYREIKNEKYSLDDFEIFREFLYLRIYLKKGEQDKAVKLIPKLEKILTKFKDKLQIDTELSILYHITVCRLEEKNYTKALQAANKLISHPLLNKRSDYECYIKIIYLIIHFELKNYELLKHLLISTYRYLCKHEKLFKTEQLVIDFIRKLQKVKTDDDLVFNFRILSKNLKLIKEDNYEKNAFEYFDLLKWVEGKLKK